MKYMVFLGLFVSSVFADVYYGRMEPFHIYNIKAAVSGQIIVADIEAQSKVAGDEVVIQIDDAVDKVDLKNAQQNLASLKKSIANAQKVLRIKKNIYYKVKALSTKSQFQKDAELVTYLNAQDQLINLETKANDLVFKVANLKDRIAKKKIVLKDLYVYAVYVEKGDFVNPSAPLVRADDLSKARVNVYLSREDVALAKEGHIYIDGKKSDKMFSKIWNVADSKNISAYRAEMILDKPAVFSKLVKIEIKK